MAAYFVDSSALVKRYVTEAGTAWMTTLLDPAARNRLYIARITGAEVIAALTRKERGGHLSAADATSAVALFQHARIRHCRHFPSRRQRGRRAYNR